MKETICIKSDKEITTAIYREQDEKIFSQYSKLATGGHPKM